MATKVQKAHTLLDKFLKDYRKSSGGYPPFTEQDEKAFHELMQAIVRAKFEHDPDGDYPINYKIINRTTHEPMHFFTLPYLHRAMDKNNLEAVVRYVELAEANVAIAASALRVIPIALRELLLEKK